MKATVLDALGHAIYLTFLYSRDFPALPAGNTTIVVVVRLGFRPDGSANNFVLTAYQISRRRS